MIVNIIIAAVLSAGIIIILEREIPRQTLAIFRILSRKTDGLSLPNRFFLSRPFAIISFIVMWILLYFSISRSIVAALACAAFLAVYGLILLYFRAVLPIRNSLKSPPQR